MTVCPHCGGALPPSRSTVWQQQQRAAGRCVECRQVKTLADARFWRCVACRRRTADRVRRRHHRRVANALT